MTNILLIALALLGVLLVMLAGWEVELRRQRDQARLMAERMEDRAVAAEIENAALRQGSNAPALNQGGRNGF